MYTYGSGDNLIILELYAVSLVSYIIYCVYFKKDDDDDEPKDVSFFKGKILQWGMAGWFCLNLGIGSNFFEWFLTFLMFFPIIAMVQFVKCKSDIQMSTAKGRAKSRRETKSINRYECTFGYMERKRNK